MYDNGMGGFSGSSPTQSMNPNNDNNGEGSGRDRGAANRRLTTASMNNRNTNRYSVTALYSMAAEQDVEVEDDLARCMSLLGGGGCPKACKIFTQCNVLTCSVRLHDSAKEATRAQRANFGSIKEELCPRKRCTISGQSNCASNCQSNGTR